MSAFSEAFSAISDFFASFDQVPTVIGFIVKDIPYLSFALGFSVVLGLVTWVLKSALRG